MAKAKAQVVEEQEEETKVSRNVGVSSGLRIWEYQNQTLAAQPKNKLTDEELAANWREEFPKAMAFDAKMVRTVRSLYNRGKHKNDAPAQPIYEYDENKNKLPLPTRGRKAATENDEADEAPAPKAKAAKPAATATVKKFKKPA